MVAVAVVVIVVIAATAVVVASSSSNSIGSVVNKLVVSVAPSAPSGMSRSWQK